MIRSIASAIIEDNAAMLALLGMTFPIYSVSNKLLWDASRSLAEKWFDIGSNGNLKRSGISVSAMSILVQAASTVNRLVPTFRRRTQPRTGPITAPSFGSGMRESSSVQYMEISWPSGRAG